MASQLAAAMQHVEPGSRNGQLGRKQAIKAKVQGEHARKLDFQCCPARFPLRYFLPDNGVRQFIDAQRLALQSVEIEFLKSYPVRIVALQGFQGSRAEITNGPPFEEGPIPRLPAIGAFIDEPGIKPFAIGIEPDLAARSEGFQASAAATGDPWLGCGLRIDGPSDPKNIAHTVLVFRLEVHQADGGTSPLRARYGDVAGRLKI